MKKFQLKCILLIIIFCSCKTTTEKDKKLIINNFTFNYVPQKPANGKLFGLVELGAAGFNSFIIDVDKDLNWELKKKEYGTSLIVEGMTNTELVNQKLRGSIDEIARFGVAAKDIYFIVSSGAAKEEITTLMVAELKKIGYTVNSVTVEEEGAYAFKAVLPKKFREDSFVVDIGSGNTKISYIKSDGSVETLESHGAKYYQKGLEDEQVFQEVRATLAQVPLNKRKQCFLIGGVPTKLARFTNKKEELYTVLNPNATYFNAFAKEAGKKVQAGLNIYKAIQEATGVQKVIYVLDGNFTTGFLLEKQK